jgi:diguanylate cyclase (GGDEF)-like protein/PAS domain S-box-containing protein
VSIVDADPRLFGLKDKWKGNSPKLSVPLRLGGGVFPPVERRRTAESIIHNSMVPTKNRFHAHLLDALGQAVIATDPLGKVVYWNSAAESLYGWSAKEAMGRPIVELTPSEELVDRAEEIMTELSRGRSWTGEFTVRRKNGTTFPALVTDTPVHDEQGNLVAIVGVSTDITEIKQTEELRRSEERFRLLAENAQDLIFRFRLKPTPGFEYVSPSATAMIGYTPEEHYADPKLGHKIVHPDDRHLIDEVLRQPESAITIRWLRKDGTVIWAEQHNKLIHDEAGELVAIEGISRDVTKRKTLEEQLEYQAFHDSLTDLPNRHLFMDRLGQALRRTRRRQQRKVAVLFMDLDNFKVVNDTLGHELGDKLLGAVVERLRGSLRPEDTLARFGGDEFTVLIEDAQSPEDLVRVTERIVEDLRESFVIDERELFVRASIGIALGDASTKSAEELLRDADMAMYRAKHDAADYRMFDPDMYEQVLERMELENDLRRALEKEEFSVYYQPKFRLGQTDKKIEGVEALVRWEHPRRGFMLPGDFIPIAEETGLIISIGGWVMKEACRQAKEWQERYPSEPPLSVCVNLSAAQVRHPGLLQDVSSTLRESGLEPGSLILEITEGTLLKDTELLQTIFRELKALGVKLAIDDFGREYSSLSYLKRLPVDSLKIDGPFLEGLGEDSTNTTIVEAVISLAHSLNLEVTGERVESAEQLEHLRRMGCDLVQGYHLVRPLPSEEVEPLLGDRPVY